MDEPGEQAGAEAEECQDHRAEPEQQRPLMRRLRRFDARAEEGLQRDREGDGEHHGVADHGGEREGDRPEAAAFERRIDLLLGEETEERRQAAHRQRRQKGGGEGDRHRPRQAAEAGDVARAGLVVDQARDHEERALEQRMGHQVEGGGGGGMLRAEAGQHDEQAERGDGGIGEHQLQVGLADRQHPADEQRQPAEGRQDRLPRRRAAEHRIEAHQQIDAGLHHRRRMQVGGDGRGRLHRVRQPEMERELRRLGEGAAEHEDEDRRIEGTGPHLLAEGEQERQLGDAGDVPQHQKTREQEQAAAAGDHQRLQRRPARGLAAMVEADQQEGGDRGQLPEHEQHQEAVGGDEAQHRAHEHQDEGEEASLMRMALQVAAGIEDDQRADAGDEQQEGQRQPVDQPGEADIVGRHPGIAAGDHFACGHLGQEPPEMQEDRRREKRKRPGGAMAEDAGQKGRGQRTQKRQTEGDERHCHFFRLHPLSLVPCPSASSPAGHRCGRRSPSDGCRCAERASHRHSQCAVSMSVSPKWPPLKSGSGAFFRA